MSVSVLQSCPATQLQKEPFSLSFAVILTCTFLHVHLPPRDRTSLLVATLTDPSFALIPVFAAVSAGYHISQWNVILDAILAQSPLFFCLVGTPKLRAAHTECVFVEHIFLTLLPTGFTQTIFAS